MRYFLYSMDSGIPFSQIESEDLAKEENMNLVLGDDLIVFRLSEKTQEFEEYTIYKGVGHWRQVPFFNTTPEPFQEEPSRESARCI